MSKYSTALPASINPEAAFVACRTVAMQLQWGVHSIDPPVIVIEQGFATMTTNPVKITARIIQSGSGSTIEILGSNYGIGPIQSRYVRKQVEIFAQQANLEIQRLTQSDNANISVDRVDPFTLEGQRIQQIRQSQANLASSTSSKEGTKGSFGFLRALAIVVITIVGVAILAVLPVSLPFIAIALALWWSVNKISGNKKL